MERNKSVVTRKHVQTPSGRISYVEHGQGAVALFVHGVLLNSHLWRHQLAELADVRRCIALDLLAHGDTEIAPDQDVSVTANAAVRSSCTTQSSGRFAGELGHSASCGHAMRDRGGSRSRAPAGDGRGDPPGRARRSAAQRRHLDAGAGLAPEASDGYE